MNYSELQNSTQPTGSVLSGKILFRLTRGNESSEVENLLAMLYDLGAVFEMDTVYIGRHTRGVSTYQNIDVVATERRGMLTLKE